MLFRNEELRGQISVEFLILLCALVGVLVVFLGPVANASELGRANLDLKAAEFAMKKIETAIFGLSVMGQGSRIEIAPNFPEGKIIFSENRLIFEYFLGKDAKKIEREISLDAKYAQFVARKGLEIALVRDERGILATEKS
ncbi:class III signal peptide-containing protein [Candidatus Micrarchaeota archaeon]|nr:class III signal peptide-containing protein [Candidatus Micrarchaeota archaeon]